MPIRIMRVCLYACCSTIENNDNDMTKPVLREHVWLRCTFKISKLKKKKNPGFQSFSKWGEF